MYRFVFDSNCIIDLEESRPNARHLQILLSFWRQGIVDIAVAAVSASENGLGGRPRESYSDFKAKLDRTGLAGCSELLPIAVWDVAFWDHALWSDEVMSALAQKIYSTLFPSIAEPLSIEAEANTLGRQNYCDSMIAWCCIQHGWSKLITSDKNFHKRKDQLAALGLTHILYPHEAAEMVVSNIPKR